MKLRGISAQQRIVLVLTALVGFGILLEGSWRWLSKAVGKSASRVQATLQGQAAIEHLKQQGHSYWQSAQGNLASAATASSTTGHSLAALSLRQSRNGI